MTGQKESGKVGALSHVTCNDTRHYTWSETLRGMSQDSLCLITVSFCDEAFTSWLLWKEVTTADSSSSFTVHHNSLCLHSLHRCHGTATLHFCLRGCHKFKHNRATHRLYNYKARLHQQGFIYYKITFKPDWILLQVLHKYTFLDDYNHSSYLSLSVRNFHRRQQKQSEMTNPQVAFRVCVMIHFMASFCCTPICTLYWQNISLH